MARTMTVDVGDELRELLAEGICSGEVKPWNKDAFLNNVRANGK